MNNQAENENRAVALLSGGLDSTVALAIAREQLTISLGLYFDYGQRAASRERDAAGAIADHYGLPLECVELPWLGRISSSALIEGGRDLPDLGEGAPADDASARAVWVENRNGIFVNIAASFAASRGCRAVVAGFNAEEAASFPDNSERFVDSVNRSLEDGTSAGVRVVCPTIRMPKRRIIEEGLRLGAPWHLIWSCYRGKDLMCGTCESCTRLKRAAAGTEALGFFRFRKE